MTGLNYIYCMECLFVASVTTPKLVCGPRVTAPKIIFVAMITTFKLVFPHYKWGQ